MKFLVAFGLFLSLHAVDKKSEQRILIIGDSLTEGYGVSQDSAYPNQLQELLKKKHPSYKVINAGSSGSTSASAINRLKWHLKSQPKILILALGGNDGLRGFPVEATKSNLGKTIDLALSKKIVVILAGMKIPMNYGKKYRADFEKVFTDLAKEKKIKFLPFLLKGVGGEKDLNLPDGIHPNEKGHKKVAQTVFDFIKGDL